MEKPFIEEEKCINCSICVDSCPHNVLEIVDDVARVIREKDCDGCGICAENCPNEAIEMKKI